MMAIVLDMSPGPWLAINDGVMGGISSGRMVQSGDVLRFEGSLSLENNGGFASVRRPIEEDLAKTTRVQLKVRGDGRTYQFRLRQDDGFDGVAWRAEFSTDGNWQTVNLVFEEFVPVFRGRQVPDAGPVAPAAIRQIGFMLADRKPGPFALEIRSITFTENSGDQTSISK